MSAWARKASSAYKYPAGLYSANYDREKRRVESSYPADVRIRAHGGDRNQTVVEAEDLVEIYGKQDYEQSAIQIAENEELSENNGDVDFGTQTSTSVVVKAVAELSAHVDYAFLEEDSDCDDESSKSSGDDT